MNMRNCPLQVISFFDCKISSLTMLFKGRTIKIISGDLKSRIDTCQKDCASLKDRFSIRVNVDTNIQVKEIKGGMQQTGTFLLVC